MQSIRMLAAVTGALVLGSACGDGGGTPPPDNEAPVANFAVPTTPPCTINVACTFTDASTDDVAVTAWSWDFNGDGIADATTQSFAYTYTAAGAYTVILTVRDAEGLSSSKINVVTVPPANPGNTPPTAGFTHSCVDGVCTFTNTSTDAAPGTITYLWNFGEPASGTNNESTLEDPTHTYTITAATDFMVTLTATDNDGATDVETQTVTVPPPPPATLDCSTSGFVVDCRLDITARSNVTVTLSGVDCELTGNKITAPLPALPADQLFFNVCTGSDVGQSRLISGGPTDAAIVFEAGSQVTIRFNQGTDTPPPGAPAARFEGTFPSWTINIDDGGNVGEVPDFNDVVLTVQATAPR